MLIRNSKLKKKHTGIDEITAELIKNGGGNEKFYKKLRQKIWNDND